MTLFFALLATSALADPVSPAPPDLVQELVPFQQWHEVAGTQVGLLFESGEQPWGHTFSHTPSLLPTDSHRKGVYLFSFDGSSPYALYFEATGQGENRMERWTAGNRLPRPYTVERFHHDTENPFQLSKRVHLVQLEVNDGTGQAPRNIHFVATDVEILEGSPDFPLDVEASMARVTREFDRLIKKERKALRSMVDEARTAQHRERAVRLANDYSDRTDKAGLQAACRAPPGADAMAG